MPPMGGPPTISYTTPKPPRRQAAPKAGGKGKKGETKAEQRGDKKAGLKEGSRKDNKVDVAALFRKPK